MPEAETNPGKEYKYHELCLIFPMLPEEELRKLGEDIRDNGQRLPVILGPEGLVVDGRNRVEACKLFGIEPFVRDKSDALKTDEDVRRFVISANLSRRNLSASERAALAVVIMEVSSKSKEEGSNNEDSPKPKGEVKKEVAEQVGVSVRYVSQAEKLKENSPEQFAQVKEGKKSIPEAEKDAAKETPRHVGRGGKVLPNEAGEKADEDAVFKKATKIVEKCQEKLGELGYRIADDTIEPI